MPRKPAGALEKWRFEVRWCDDVPEETATLDAGGYDKLLDLLAEAIADGIFREYRRREHDAMDSGIE
jgi:hypothetical protein